MVIQHCKVQLASHRFHIYTSAALVQYGGVAPQICYMLQRNIASILKALVWLA